MYEIPDRVFAAPPPRHRVTMIPHSGTWVAWCYGCPWSRDGDWEFVDRERLLHSPLP